MHIARRRLVAAALSIPVLALAGRGISLLGGAVAGAIKGARPAADGTSATRCAQCGSADHTMLDAACPMAPRVLA